MKYRKFGKCDFNASALGFGCMRFPVFENDNSKINEAEAIKMIHHAIESGINYFDTAYPYHGGNSETLVAKALKGGYREKIKLATKLPTWLIKTPSDYDKYLNEQLKKLDTKYVDLYLLHALNKDRWKNLMNMNVTDALDKYKASGKVKYIGFSFHDDFNTFKNIVDSYNWDFCQIQFNFMDEHKQAGIEGLKYAASKGMAVVIMEPLRGGKLSNIPPKEVADIWKQSKIKRTPAEWSLRWIWNHPEVSVVLSGMSSMEQLDDNLRIADCAESNSLTCDELSLVSKAKAAYESLTKVGCTACKYCMPCPSMVNIPQNFSLYNEAFMYNELEKKKAEYKNLKPENRASNCKSCGKCENVCPQNLPIRKLLKDVNEALGK